MYVVDVLLLLSGTQKLRLRETVRVFALVCRGLENTSVFAAAV